MKHLKFITPVVLALAISSCGTNDPAKELLKTDFSNHFAFITSQQNDTLFSECGNIHIEFNDDDNIASLQISNFSDSESKTSLPRTLGADKIPFTADNHGVRKGDYQPSGNEISHIAFTYFPEKEFNGTKVAGIALTITLSSGKKATFFPEIAYGYGATETENTNSNDKFVSTSMYYVADLSDAAYRNTKSATVLIEKAQFMSQMPAVGTMQLFTDNDETQKPAIRASFSHEGYTLSAPMIVPTINDIPYPQYALTNFTLNANSSSNESEIAFNCMRVFKVDAVVSSVYCTSYRSEKKE